MNKMIKQTLIVCAILLVSILIVKALAYAIEWNDVISLSNKEHQFNKCMEDINNPKWCFKKAINY